MILLTSFNISLSLSSLSSWLLVGNHLELTQLTAIKTTNNITAVFFIFCSFSNLTEIKQRGKKNEDDSLKLKLDV